MNVSSGEFLGMVQKHELWLVGNKNGERLQIVEEDIVGLDLSGMNLKDAYISKCNFIECNLSEIKAEKASWFNCSFSSCDLGNVDMSSSTFRYCKFMDVDATGSNFQDTVFTGSDFIDVNFTGANLNRSDFYNTSRKEVVFTGVVSQGIRHINLFSCSGVGEDGHSIVYDLDKDKVFFGDKVMRLAEFGSKLTSGYFGLGSLEIEVFKQILLVLFKYRESNDIILAG